ncbi:MAG: anti-sigma factor family protein [Solirubrobacteraceae bacterium]
MIRHRQPPTERDLTALADGSLPAAKRVRVERAVAASPELQAIVAAQRRALAAIDTVASERAPAALRARLELQRGPEKGRARTGPRFAVPSFGVARVIPAAVVGAIALVAVLVVTLGGGLSAPTVAQASVLATRPAVAPAPPHQRHTLTLAGLRAAGLPYPYWDDRFGLSAVGVRHDRLGRRPATTVFYKSGNRRVAYSIVSGSALPFGVRAHRVMRNGVAVWTLRANGMRVATWLRHGHSCVLVSKTVPFSQLVNLASWRAAY